MEQNRKGVWRKTLLIVVFCGAMDIAIHALQKADLVPGAPSYFRSPVRARCSHMGVAGFQSVCGNLLID